MCGKDAPSDRDISNRLSAYACGFWHLAMAMGPSESGDRGTVIRSQGPLWG